MICGQGHVVRFTCFFQATKSTHSVVLSSERFSASTDGPTPTSHTTTTTSTEVPPETQNEEVLGHHLQSTECPTISKIVIPKIVPSLRMLHLLKGVLKVMESMIDNLEQRDRYACSYHFGYIQLGCCTHFNVLLCYGHGQYAHPQFSVENNVPSRVPRGRTPRQVPLYLTRAGSIRPNPHKTDFFHSADNNKQPNS